MSNFEGAKFNISFVYGQNFESLRAKLWENLESDAFNIFRPLMIIGDFSCIRFAKEKKGGNHVLFHKLQEMDPWINRLCINKLNILGFNFSWWLGPERNILLKIDSVFTYNLWMKAFKDTTARYLDSGVSDHSHILVSLVELNVYISRSFRYMNKWHLFEDYLDCRWANRS